MNPTPAIEKDFPGNLSAKVDGDTEAEVESMKLMNDGHRVVYYLSVECLVHRCKKRSNKNKKR